MKALDLEALAGRCEAASGPDRELDLAILRVVEPEWMANLDATNRRPLDWGIIYMTPSNPPGKNFSRREQGSLHIAEIRHFHTSGIVGVHHAFNAPVSSIDPDAVFIE